MLTSRMIGAALAAAIALPAAAQNREAMEERIRRAQERSADAQPAPAPQAGGQPGQAQQLTEEQRAALGVMWGRNKLAFQAGEMALTRGASDEVRHLGNVLTQAHRHIESVFTEHLRQRGTDPNALAAGPEQQRIQGELGQLSTKTGEEFDREFVAFVTRNHVSLVEDLKRARDVTPGKDALLKKWLDDVENGEEDHLAQARQLKAKRQARTPPAR
jgi:putative membrane protein